MALASSYLLLPVESEPDRQTPNNSGTEGTVCCCFLDLNRDTQPGIEVDLFIFLILFLFVNIKLENLIILYI